MRRGRHAAADGSFGRSAAVNAGRGAILILIALVIGIVLLQDFDDGPDNIDVSQTPDATPDTTEPLSTLPSTSTLPVRANKDIKVLVANGTTVSGAAGRVSQPLRDAGYNVLAPVDASPAVKANTRASAVYFATPDFEREAQRLREALNIAAPVATVPSPPPTADLRGANVVILVGPDLANAGTTTTTG